MERIGRDMDDLRKKMETFIKNNGRLNEQNPKTEAEEAAEERKKFSKLPMRQLTISFIIRPYFQLSKLPMRQLTNSFSTCTSASIF